MVAKMTTGITVDNATCCQVHKLEDCPYVYFSWPWKQHRDEKGEHTVTHPDCGDNGETAKECTIRIMGVVSKSSLRSVQATVEDKVDYHNTALGTHVSFDCMFQL